MSFDAWGNRRDPATGVNYTTTPANFIIAREYTGHEYLTEFGLINMNGRVNDPVIARFLSPDSFIQAPVLAQNYKGYTYCLNNPLIYTDSSGDFNIEAMRVGAFINTFIQGMIGNIESNGDAYMAFGIGALSGASGGGADNAWMGGAGLGQGFLSGIVSSGIGALGSALTGSLSGEIQYHKQISIFSKGLNELGIDETGPVSVTDDFLIKAQIAWFPDAPMNRIKAFTVENVPQGHLTGKNGLVTKGEFAKNVPLPENGIINGNLKVFFNKDLAFNSSNTLFCKMGHEFVHVHQNMALTGKSATLFTNALFVYIIELQAYTYENTLGKIHYNSFRSAADHTKAFPELYKLLNYTNFGLPPVEAFKYPF